MKNIALVAEYFRIIEVKGFDIFYRVCNDPSNTVLDGGDIFPISFTLCLVLILRMPPVPISWLQVAAWIFVSISLYSVLLIFFYYMLS